MTEIRILGRVKHENLIKLKSVYIYNNDIHIVMPRMKCDLSDIVREKDGLPQEVVIYITREIVEGLHHLYTSEGLFHGDIKTENVLVSEAGEIKLADFGFATRIDIDPGITFGTLKAMAPEVADLNRPFDASADIWAMGILMIE
ncbi:MAG: kinase-like domain-containing protein, partial [Benjaminiella poitrasii]